MPKAYQALAQQARRARLEALAQLALLVQMAPAVPLATLGLQELREEAVLQGPWQAQAQSVPKECQPRPTSEAVAKAPTHLASCPLTAAVPPTAHGSAENAGTALLERPGQKQNPCLVSQTRYPGAFLQFE